MNKDAIIKTAQTRWDEEDASYVTESPLDDGISGAGDSPEEAFQIFLEMVDMNYQAYLQGRHAIYNGPGRPQKDKVSINARVAPSVKSEIAAIAKKYGISQGEAIEYAFGALKKQQKQA